MPEIHVVVGVAGAGKTRHAMNLIEERLRDGIRWDQIGFASFSRAACSEAARRASVITGIDSDRLQKDGWFRTIHSSVFRCLGLDSKVILDHDTKVGREFVADACGAARGGDTGTLGARVEEALSFWDVCRSRLSRMTQTSQIDADGVTVIGCQRPCTTLAAPCPRTLSPSKFIGEIDVHHPSLRLHREEFSEIYFDQQAANAKQNPVNGDFLHTKIPSYIGNIKEISLPRPLVCHPEFLHVYPVKRDDLPDDTVQMDRFEHIIRQYEDAKRYSGMRDFTDILLEYAGFQVDSDLNFKSGYAMGTVPQDLQVFFADEYQDCNALLDHCVKRLSGFAQELWMLGDGYQNVYAFSGAQRGIFEAHEKVARSAGRRTLLNQSYRNPMCVIDWGEQVLREDSEYEERNPFSTKTDGSVGMMEASDFYSCLPDLAKTDTMILSRTWFGLKKAQDRLNELCIPWTSCQEKRSSPWECPVKIALLLTLQALRDGEKISEQDWRRLTENFPMKLEGLELFKRGEKARWKKMACSGDLVNRLDQVSEWGAGEGFEQFVIEEKWRKDQLLLLGIAVEKWGIDVVRRPRIQIGSCHSVKGLEAENVFVLATSSEKASQSGFYEDLFLKYVCVTRASRHYRVVVDLQEHARGRKLFLPCPAGYWSFEKGLPHGIRDANSNIDSEMVQKEEMDLDREVSSGNIREDRNAGSATIREREVSRNGSEGSGGTSVGDAAVRGEEDQFDWWKF